MTRFLQDNPVILMVLNCCGMPLLFGAVGYLVGRYRPRLRVPWTVGQDTGESEY